MRKRLKYFLIFLVLIGLASVLFLSRDKIQASQIEKEFVLEAYDLIENNYWAKPEDYNLPLIFKLSFEKALGETTNLGEVKNRQDVERMIKNVLREAPSKERRKELALNALAIALYNLEPVGRNALYSEKAETEMRDNVANIDRETNLYSNLGLEKKVSIDEVPLAYENRLKEIESLPQESREEAREKAKQAVEVLNNETTKIIYDEHGALPTVFHKAYLDTLYINLSKIAPTTLWEFARIVESSSTTPRSTLVVDLRENVGGALDFLPAFLGLFLGFDQHALDLYSQGEKEVLRTTQPKFEPMSSFKEIAFLVGSVTQSTAEITPETFRRYNLGKIIGTTTKGWGTVENTFSLNTKIDPSEKYTLFLVHSITLRNDNEPIEGRGITPDINTIQIGWEDELSKHFSSPSLIRTLKELVPLTPLR